MGFAISWIAFKGKSADEVAGFYMLSRSGEFEEIPESKFSGTKLGSGWYVVVINECGHTFVREPNLRRLSKVADVIAASVEEHVMFSSAEEWKDGELVWKVTHEGEDGPLGPRHLKEEGALPESYAAIKHRQFAAQQQEDAKEPDQVDHIFDIPLELAESIVGYRHDKILEAQFEVLKPKGSGLRWRIFRKN